MTRQQQTKTSFGQFMRSLRQKLDEPLRVVAAAVEIDSTLLSRIERGERFPTDEQLARFARFFKIPAEELKGRVIADRVTAECDSAALQHAAQILHRRAASAKATA